MVDQILQLALVQIAAHMLAKVFQPIGIAQQHIDPRAIGTGQPPDAFGAKPSVIGHAIDEKRVEPRWINIAAGQGFVSRPTAVAKAADLLQRMLCQFSESGDFAAKDGQDRRCAAFLVQLKHIIAGDGGIVFRLVIIQRAYPSIAGDRLFGRDASLQIFVHRITDIMLFILGNIDSIGVAFEQNIGGANQCKIVLIGNGKDDPIVAVLEDIGMAPFEQFGEDQMASLHQPQILVLFGRYGAAQHGIHPRSSGVDHNPRLHGFLATFAAQFGGPKVAAAFQINALCAGANVRAAFLCIHAIERDHPRILDPAIGIFKPLGQPFLQHLGMGVIAQIDRACTRQQFAAAQIVIEIQPQPQHPFGPQTLVMWKHKTQRPDDMRRNVEQALSLDQALAHQPEFVMLQIAKAAMHQLGTGG